MKKRPTKISFFSLVELIVIISVLSILATLLVGSLQSIAAKSDDIDCHTKLKTYGTAYALYLEDNQGEYPYRMIQRRGVIVKDAQINWAQVVWSYKDMFQYNTSMNDTPSLQCSSFVRIGSEKSYTFKANYRGYTSVHNKTIYSLNHSPSEVAVVGDGVIAWDDRGYSYHFISNINESRIANPYSTPKWGDFRLSDFIHSGTTVNASFADMSVKSMTPEYILSHAKQIFDRNP